MKINKTTKKELFTTILLITIFFTIILTLGGCSQNNQINLTEEEIRYIENISTFNINDNEEIDNYMYLYIKYRNSLISESNLEFIRENTDSEYFEKEIRYDFITTMENKPINKELIEMYFQGANGYTIETLQKDAEGNYILEGESYIKEEDWDSVRESGDKIIKKYYFFKEGEYALKIMDKYGQESIVYFKVKDGKVTNINEL